MPERLTDAQVRNAREQALRAVRRAQRALDTKNEVMERRLDRAIENKERITIVVAVSILKDYRDLIAKMRNLETTLTAMSNIYSTTGNRIP